MASSDEDEKPAPKSKPTTPAKATPAKKPASSSSDDSSDDEDEKPEAKSKPTTPAKATPAKKAESSSSDDSSDEESSDDESEEHDENAFRVQVVLLLIGRYFARSGRDLDYLGRPEAGLNEQDLANLGANPKAVSVIG